MLLGDIFLIVGCGNGYNACALVEWFTASTMLIIKGRPALTLTSVGLCKFGGGLVAGPAVITYTQMGQLEPTELTIIHD
jgi:hypothetical protein